MRFDGRWTVQGSHGQAIPLGLGALGLLVLSGCSRLPAERDEALGEVSSAISTPAGPNGSADTSDVNTEVVVQVTVANQVGCTATLVTPTLLLLANHCITGDASGTI